MTISSSLSFPLLSIGARFSITTSTVSREKSIGTTNNIVDDKNWDFKIRSGYSKEAIEVVKPSKRHA